MAQAHDLIVGRTIAATFDHGEDFFTGLTEICQEHGIRQGYIPMFIAGLAEVDIVGTCDKLENPDAPVWSKVHLTTAEALGAGTIAWDDENATISPHIHISVGLKAHSANGYTSHLLGATVQFLVEMIIVEVTHPQMRRPRNPGLFDVPQLTFSS